MNIDSKAVVSKKARLADDVEIGPYSVIGDDVTLGPQVKVGAHCVIQGTVTVGKKCEIFTGAILGSQPQDLKYKGEKTSLEIGENNIIREYATLNLGTKEGGGRTVVGNNNLLMAYTHVAHDCHVGNDNIIANAGTLAGHVTIEDNVVVGGLVAIHQFVRVGKLSIIGGCSKVVQDIPPFSTCDGHPARVYGLNLVGLRRHAVPRPSIELLRHAFLLLFHSGLTISHALETLSQEKATCREVERLVEFVKNSRRGVSRSCRSKRFGHDKSED